MKPFACVAFFLVVASSAAAENLPAKVWRKVKTYDMQALQKAEPLPMRQIVGVRFHYRSKDIRHLKPNWFYSSIWSERRAGGRVQFDSIPIMVAKLTWNPLRRSPPALDPPETMSFTARCWKTAKLDSSSCVCSARK